MAEKLRINGIDHNDINLGNVLYDSQSGKFSLIDFDSSYIIPTVGEALPEGKVTTIKQNLERVFHDVDRALKKDNHSLLSGLDAGQGSKLAFETKKLPGASFLLARKAKRSLKKALPIAQSKLDNALTAMSNSMLEKEVKLAQDAFFGKGFFEDPASQQRLTNFLTDMRDDMSKISEVNFDISDAGSGSAVAALSKEDYLKFARDPNSKFLKVNKGPLSSYYKKMSESDSAIADVLVHEISHGKPQSLDFIYVGTQKQATGDVDIYELINLGNNKIKHESGPLGDSPVSDFAGSDLPNLKNVRGSKGIKNADSIAQYVSLLDKSRTNQGAFDMDIKKLRQVETDTMEFSQRLEDSVEVSRAKRSIMEEQDTPDFSGMLIAVNRAGNQFDIYSRVEESGS